MLVNRAILLPALLLAIMASGCEYGKLARPKVAHELSLDMVRLVNELPELDKQNEAIIGRFFAHGGLGHAKMGDDGVMREQIEVPTGAFIWKPAIIVMPQAGELELEFNNKDDYTHHGVYLPSNGERQILDLPKGHRGRARVQLDAPGLYWFGCPVANHAGRGMLGFILVKGETPDEAKLDRPEQKRP